MKYKTIHIICIIALVIYIKKLIFASTYEKINYFYKKNISVRTQKYINSYYRRIDFNKIEWFIVSPRVSYLSKHLKSKILFPVRALILIDIYMKRLSERACECLRIYSMSILWRPLRMH